MEHVLANVGRLAVGGVAAGVIAAGIALPVVGGVGFTLRDVIDGFRNLPSSLREGPLPQKTRLLDATGTQFAQFYYENREAVPLDRISPLARQAVVAIEDSRFFEHAGLDVKGTIRAVITNAQAGEIRQGGSSLTQQYVKNVLVEAAETEKEREAARAPNLGRKISELRYALALEQKYSKQEILERYLNVAYFGAGAYGVQAAAKRFFGKTAAQLTLVEAATIAGAVRSPHHTDPSLGPQSRARLKERRDVVLDRMAELKMVSPEEAAKAKARPLRLQLNVQPASCEDSGHPYFCEYVQREILNSPAFGQDPAERAKRLIRGGIVIRTTLRPRIQRAAEHAIRERVSPADTEVAAEAMIEPGTGYIRALAGSKLFGRNPGNKKNGPYTNFNLPADAAHGGGVGLQAGSTFKVFTLATALAQGWRFNQGFDTPGVLTPSAGYRDCAGRPVNAPDVQIYNASGEGRGGPYSLSTGTWESVNIFYMMLERKVGLCATMKTAEALGVRRADGGPLRPVPTFTLGVNEMDPVTVAASFAAFAARGRYCEPLAIAEITDFDGTRTPVSPTCRQAIDPEVADAVSHVLRGVFAEGTMRGQDIGRPAAGKTGTNNGYTSAWFAGYTPDLAAAVSVGDIRGPYRYPLTGTRIGDTYFGQVQGASLPGPIWVQSMRRALAGTYPTYFHRPNLARFGGGVTPGLEEKDKERKVRRDPETGEVLASPERDEQRTRRGARRFRDDLARPRFHRPDRDLPPRFHDQPWPQPWN
ncbi:transglycosylase domain-containing protein [Rhizohabitans arisaemae]|uniref:transglycosylase domain-containing protein n=1 Tax=Rhizohabitans arisaemae TaxID=2720610 RepID=UPI0024B24482|nr:transglycosylase domain-containing protein [Rhizohabitans arisaemae]